MADSGSTRSAKKCADLQRILHREAEIAQTKKINDILKLPACERSAEQNSFLDGAPEVVQLLKGRAKAREKQRQRSIEKEDSMADFQAKCVQLAQALSESSYTVVYTGAGISTAASIPDYRGPNGVWTLLRRGETPKAVELSDAEPTYTHMSIAKLHSEGLIKHVVSQNCDGLHMRSGLPRTAISELHGNMYLELCKSCKPVTEQIRLFDVTERTGLRKHKTGRKCHKCKGDLTDSIIHFGEKGPLHSPYNWKQAAKAADQAQLIVCLGTSLKVLRRYACLWNMHKPPAERPKLIVINLMWTPKDDLATLKINGKCDEAMRFVMENLKMIPENYNRLMDPIFTYAVPLNKRETNTCSKKILQEPAGYNKATICTMLSDVIARQPPVEADDSDDDNSGVDMSDIETEEDTESQDNLDLNPPEVIKPGKDAMKKAGVENKTIKTVAVRKKPEVVNTPPLRRHNTRKRKLSAKMVETLNAEYELNGSDYSLCKTVVNGNKKEKTNAVAKQRKTGDNVGVPVKKSPKKRGRPVKKGRAKVPVVKVLKRDITKKKDSEMKEETNEVFEGTENVSGGQNGVTKSKTAIKDEHVTLGESKQTLANGHHQSKEENKDTHKLNDPQVPVTVGQTPENTQANQNTEVHLESNGVEPPQVTQLQQNISSGKVVLDQSDIMGVYTLNSSTTDSSLPVNTLLNISTSDQNNSNNDAAIKSTMNSPPQASPTVLSPGSSKKKTLNNFLEKVQARRVSSSEPSSEHVLSPSTVLQLQQKIRPDSNLGVSKSPKKIKDYYVADSSKSNNTRVINQGSSDVTSSKTAPVTSLSNVNTAADSNERVICVNGCEGYEPGEVHYHAANQVPKVDNSVLGIPNLDIQQVWAATYSACFMASYQALQNKVLQQQAKAPHLPVTLPQFNQTDLMNLTADVGFQTQLLAQFQQNLLRSMAGVVSPDKQAHVLAQTQQVLMQNIAAMNKTNSAAQAAAAKSETVTATIINPPPPPQSIALPIGTSQMINAAVTQVVNDNPLNSPSVMPPGIIKPTSSSAISPASSGTSLSTSATVAAILANQRALVSPTSSTSSSETGHVSSSYGNGPHMTSPSTSPGPGGSTSPRLSGRHARGVCGPRVKHKKKWWEIQPSNEVSDIVNKHLTNIRQAAQHRSIVRQEIERQTQALPGDLKKQTPQRCKRRSLDGNVPIAIAPAPMATDETVAMVTESGSPSKSLSPQLITQQQQREAALRALIEAQQQPLSNAIASHSNQPLGVDMTNLTSAEQALMGGGGMVTSDNSVVTIEPQAPDEDSTPLDFSLDGVAANVDNVDAEKNELNTGVQEPTIASATIMPGWFGKGWKANKRIGRRKKSR